MERFTLRDAKPNDAAALAKLGEETFRKTFEANYSPKDLQHFLSTAYALPKVQAELLDSRYHCFVAERGEEMVGYALLRNGPVEPCVTGPNPIELERIYVLSPAFGSGLGQALLDRCVKQAVALGHSTLWLGVWEHNLRAQAFYRRNGFAEVGSHHFMVGSSEDLDLIFQKPLP